MLKEMEMKAQGSKAQSSGAIFHRICRVPSHVLWSWAKGVPRVAMTMMVSGTMG